MVVVKGPVEFQMGSPGHELFRDHSQETTKQVRIPRTFAIASAELTLQKYKEFDPGFSYASDYTPSELCPVNSISWLDAVKYCRWLSEQEGIDEDQMCYPPLRLIGEGFELPANFLERTGYRLPTEAEWEYACRAGSTAAFANGGITYLQCERDDNLDAVGWYCGNSNNTVQPVAGKMPNGWGLYDMHGNVQEWCQDWFGVYPYDAVTNPKGPTKGSYRVMRSGVWYSPARDCRSASRFGSPPHYRFRHIGFRVCLTP
jgi:hypothetical protein